jgi:hypothetical protein
VSHAALIVCALGGLAITGAGAASQTMVAWTRVETAHFRFHFQEKPQVDPQTFSQRTERGFDEILAFFKTSPPARIDFYVWADPVEADRLLGRPLAFARPDRLLIHSAAGHTPAHELVHVFLFHAIHPEHASRFLEEGTAVALDGSGRDILAEARAARRRNPSASVANLWESGSAASSDMLYPIAGAFVSRLLAYGGKEQYLALLKNQTTANARTVYGSTFDRFVSEFDAELSRPEQLDQTALQPSQPSPSLDALRRKAQDRMRMDAAKYSRSQLQDIERTYQSANANLRAPGARAALVELLDKYPQANRTGCAVLYLAQMSQGDERERFLTLAIDKHGDAMYGNGAQVGALARAQLAVFYVETSRPGQAKALVNEIVTQFPGAVDHGGSLLVETLRRMKLLD